MFCTQLALTDSSMFKLNVRLNLQLCPIAYCGLVHVAMHSVYVKHINLLLTTVILLAEATSGDWPGTALHGVDSALYCSCSSSFLVLIYSYSTSICTIYLEIVLQAW